MGLYRHVAEEASRIESNTVREAGRTGGLITCCSGLNDAASSEHQQARPRVPCGLLVPSSSELTAAPYWVALSPGRFRGYGPLLGKRPQPR